MDWKSIHDIAEEILYTNEDEDDNDNDDKNTTSRCDSNNTIGEADTRTQQPTYYWTPTEYQELLRGIELYGMESTNKLATLLPGRSESAILNYCRRNSLHLPPTTTRDTAQQLLHDRGLLLRSHTDTATTTAAAATGDATGDDDNDDDNDNDNDDDDDTNDDDNDDDDNGGNDERVVVRNPTETATTSSSPLFSSYTKFPMTTASGKHTFIYYNQRQLRNWNATYAQLRHYQREHRHEPESYKYKYIPSTTTHYKLQKWFMNQRREYKTGRMSDDHKQKLRLIGINNTTHSEFAVTKSHTHTPPPPPHEGT